MKRRVELYISGHRVDLDDDALVLMSYAATDLYNPTAVRNSFSREIRIPGTPANDDIFGCFFRVDRRLGAAAAPPRRRSRSTSVTWSGNGDVAFAGEGVALNLGSFVYDTNRPGESVTIGGTYNLSVNLTLPVQAVATGHERSVTLGIGCVLFVQAIGYDVDGNKVAASPTQALHWWPSFPASDFVALTGYTPDPLNTSVVDVDDSAVTWSFVGEGSHYYEYMRDAELTVAMTAVGLKRVDILLTWYNYTADLSAQTLSAFTITDYPAFTISGGGSAVISGTSFAVNSATPSPDPPEPPTPDPPTPGYGNYRTAFDPSARADFAVYADGGNLLMTGYAKLTDVVETGAVHTYALSLYGGLGSFMYNLTQRADGERMTLADLDYLGGGDAELDFDITAQAVSDAWARLGGDTSKPEMWDVINFAPAYDGIPEGDFAPDKAVATPSDLGLQPTVTREGVAYTTRDGRTVLNYPAPADEWAAKDLRSYLQRPVVSVWRFLQACANPDNNGGWAVDLSDLEADWPYRDVWLTRPLLPSLGTYRQSSGDIQVSWSARQTSGPDLLDISVGGMPSGTEVTIRTSFRLQLNLGSAPGRTTMFTYRNEAGGVRQSVWFLQLVGYASDDSVVAASPVTIYGPTLSFVQDLAAFADACTFVPEVPAGQEAQYVAAYGFDQGSMTGSGTDFSSRGAFTLEAAGRNIYRAEVIVKRGTILWDQFSGRVHSVQNLATLYDDTGPTATPYVEDTSELTDISVTATMQTASSLRSGAHVTKRMLLSTAHTPAEYIVSICKAFGLMLVTDPVRKSVAIMRRSTFYAPGAGDMIDLTRRVDLTHDVTLLPLTYDARWYDFKHEIVKGAFAKEYAETEGVDYGIQRVDTGYAFDAEAKDLLARSALRSCAPVRDRGPQWYRHTGQAGFLPAPLAVPPGGSYTLWDAAGSSATDVAIDPGVVSADPYSAGLPGYDPAVSRAEFRDAAGKPLAGEDVLLFGPQDTLLDWHTLQDFNLTDDLPAMDSIIGKPCWVAATNPSGLRIPVFTRLKSAVIFGERVVTLSLDFGIPRQVAIPNISYYAGTIYIQAWRQFMRDRLDVDNKVLRCRIHVDGLEVGPELLRRFYWWRGSLWALNAITNYSLTTYDTVECEFVQVREINNYTTQY